MSKCPLYTYTIQDLSWNSVIEVLRWQVDQGYRERNKKLPYWETTKITTEPAMCLRKCQLLIRFPNTLRTTKPVLWDLVSFF